MEMVTFLQRKNCDSSYSNDYIGFIVDTGGFTFVITIIL